MIFDFSDSFCTGIAILRLKVKRLIFYIYDVVVTSMWPNRIYFVKFGKLYLFSTGK